MIRSETLKQMLQSSQRRPPLVTEDPIYFSIAVIGIPVHDVKTEILFVFEVMIKRAFRYTGSGQNILNTRFVVTVSQHQLHTVIEQ